MADVLRGQGMEEAQVYPGDQQEFFQEGAREGGDISHKEKEVLVHITAQDIGNQRALHVKEEEYGHQKILETVAAGAISEQVGEVIEQKLNGELIKQRIRQVTADREGSQFAGEITVGQLLSLSRDVVARQEEAFAEKWKQEGGAQQVIESFERAIDLATDAEITMILQVAQQLGGGQTLNRESLQQAVREKLHNSNLILPDNLNISDESQMRDFIREVLPLDSLLPELLKEKQGQQVLQQNTNENPDIEAKLASAQQEKNASQSSIAAFQRVAEKAEKALDPAVPAFISEFFDAHSGGYYGSGGGSEIYKGLAEKKNDKEVNTLRYLQEIFINEQSKQIFFSLFAKGIKVDNIDGPIEVMPFDKARTTIEQGFRDISSSVDEEKKKRIKTVFAKALTRARQALQRFGEIKPEEINLTEDVFRYILMQSEIDSTNGGKTV